MDILSSKVVMGVAAALIGVVGAISYSWASWTTETLIAVDKRTEVMAVQMQAIKLELERLYATNN
ncbi:MAG: hypothetical protein VW683_04400 [Betaproteobacteria bacterium]